MGEIAVAKRVDDSDFTQHAENVAIAQGENAVAIAPTNPAVSGSLRDAGSTTKSKPHSPSILPLPAWLKRPDRKSTRLNSSH